MGLLVNNAKHNRVKSPERRVLATTPKKKTTPNNSKPFAGEAKADRFLATSIAPATKSEFVRLLGGYFVSAQAFIEIDSQAWVPRISERVSAANPLCYSQR